MKRKDTAGITVNNAVSLTYCGFLMCGSVYFAPWFLSQGMHFKTFLFGTVLICLGTGTGLLISIFYGLPDKDEVLAKLFPVLLIVVGFLLLLISLILVILTPSEQLIQY